MRFQRQDIDLLARCKHTVAPSKRIARVRRPENRSSLTFVRGAREGLEWRMKKEARRGRDRGLFLDPPSSSAARNLETRLRTNREYPRGAHPESLNHPILISRTVRRAYPTYPLPRNASVHLAIFLARWWIKREDEFVLFVIWRLLNTHWSTVGTLYIIKSHYSLSLYFIRGAYPSRKNSM